MAGKTLVAVFSASGVTKKQEKRLPVSQARISLKLFQRKYIQMMILTG